MGWKITYDFLEKRGVSIESWDWGKRGKGLYPFRLYDGDGDSCYEGLSTDNETMAAFAPLGFGAGAAGCTAIKYLRKGIWEGL